MAPSCAACSRPQRTGVGRFVEVAMLEAVFPALSSSLGMYHGARQPEPAAHRQPPRRHGGGPYNVYPAKDGWVALFCVSEAHFTALAAAMERPDMRN